jgi:hypothetical protein
MWFRIFTIIMNEEVTDRTLLFFTASVQYGHKIAAHASPKAGEALRKYLCWS